MKARARAVAVAAGERSSRSLVVIAAAFIFLFAQALFAAHAAAPVDDLKGHSVAECALCLAGGVADDTARAAPALCGPPMRTEALKTAIPAALLTEIAVRAASPRAPPSA